MSIEICKLTLDFLTNGFNSNRFQAIAGKFMLPHLAEIDLPLFVYRFGFSGKINTNVAALQDAVNALIMLQLNSIKTNVRRILMLFIA